MRVLAVDLAAKTGAALGRPQGKPEAWAIDFARWTGPARLAKVIEWATHMRSKADFDLCAIEAPIGGKDANAMLIGMTACLQAQMHILGIRTVTYAAATVRHHFLGKALTSRHFPGLSQAKAKIEIKQRVADRCRALGWQVDTLDCADALALWDYACAQESLDHQVATVGGLFGGALERASV